MKERCHSFRKTAGMTIIPLISVRYLSTVIYLLVGQLSRRTYFRILWIKTDLQRKIVVSTLRPNTAHIERSTASNIISAVKRVSLNQIICCITSPRDGIPRHIRNQSLPFFRFVCIFYSIEGWNPP
jgi:hypothetical protein